ncbi:beta-N-acetylhexosaminidase [Branchiibius hedensis]|uniref:Beta-N-acetylhexosaminidase n=1 Tax=Branchiibius hedensis TaxID=672460 RepID=A0A2Y9A1K2_9MICO|nr:glycoside hydrolase family 3 N-terminal domain-containing protein [Branchiibius hedensis]PWJ27276.1 beta-N-acetylhexosaminidase [Branchiibius hedensis]SSA36087.1 beta-N-acetylhexosaminidase [Branchiibius hedensis]
MSSANDITRAAYGVLLAAFDGTSIPAWLPTAYDAGLGGICLYGNNIAEGSSLARLGREVRALAPDAVLTLDEEGGDVTRLHTLDGSPYPGNAALGRVDDVDATRVVAAAIGAELRDAGVWFNLAPVADVNSNWRNPVIGTRSFGASAELVGRHTIAYLIGLADAGVAGCLKHFPGHGDTATDSHVSLPTVTADAETVRRRELLPFRMAIASQAPAIMTSHVLLKALDPDRPATLSHRVLTGLLREELGYAGVIVTDALDMAGASQGRGIPAAAVESLIAGADLLCLGPQHGPTPTVLLECVRAIEQAVSDGVLPAARLFDAAQRVLTLRSRWTSMADPDRAMIATGRTRAKAVAERVVAGAPRLAPGPVTVLRITSGTNPAVGETVWGQIPIGPSTDIAVEDLDQTPPPTGPAVIVGRRASSDPRVWAWLAHCLEQNPEAVAVELGWPTPAAVQHPAVVCTWGQARVLTDALADALLSEGPPTIG